MKYAVYFVPREGVHPHATLDDYQRLWPIMHRSVRALGHRLIHITDDNTANWGDECFRVPGLDPSTTMRSRDVAWHQFVQSLQPGEQACMIEPDTVMLRDVPPIAEGHDMVLLRRPESVVPGWFKLAKRTAEPFYRAVVENYAHVDRSLWAFHGDIRALHMTLGIGKTANLLPTERCGVRIEVRDWPCYGFRKAHARMREQVFHQYKGTSKADMLALE